MAKDRLTGKLAVILHADVAGSTALVQQDEQLAHERIQDTFHRFGDLITRYHGHVQELRGDALLAEFERASDAVTAALAFQMDQTEFITQFEDNIQPIVRVGIAMGEVIIADDTITGEGVVLAQRLEQLAKPGAVCIQGAAYETIPGRFPFEYENLGEHKVKGFDESVRAYRAILSEGKLIPPPQEINRQEVSGLSRNQIVGVLAIVVVAVLAAIYWLKPWGYQVESASVEHMALPLPEKPSIAVLAFTNLSGDPSKTYLSDGISENIITALSRFSQLFVISRQSSFSYKDKPVTIKQVSEELGVRYVLEGSVQVSGDKLRVTAQLINALKGNHVWAENYDRNLEDIFEVQDEIISDIVATLKANIDLSEFERVKNKAPKSLNAFENFALASSYWFKYTKEDNQRALEYYEKARELDPDWAEAYRGIAWVHINGYRWGWSGTLSRERSLELAFENAYKGVELAPFNHRLHQTLAEVLIQAGRLDEATAEYNQAIQLNPNDASVLAGATSILIFTGKSSQAVGQLKQAIRMNPYHPVWYLWNLGFAQYFIEDYEAAVESFMQMKKIPNLARRQLAAAYVGMGNVTEARAVIEEFLKNDPDYSITKIRLNFKDKFTNPKDLERFIADLRTAGLPENSPLPLPLPLPDKPSIAVLPFTNMSGDAEQEYFVDGLTEDLITDISKISGLDVIARNSTFSYKGQTPDVREVGRDLGASHVIEGSVRKAGDTIRITIQLVNAADGKHVWAERYDRELRDVFAIQDEVIGKIITALSLNLTPEEVKHVVKRGTENLEAYDLYMRGRQQESFFTREGHIEAQRYYEQAVDLDPDYAEVLAHLAQIHTLNGQFGWVDDIAAADQRALKLVEKSIQLDPDIPFSRFSYSRILSRDSIGQLDRAVEEANKAIELDPNYADARAYLAQLFILTGQAEKAIGPIKEAMLINPSSPFWYHYTYGFAYYFMNDFDTAAENIEKAVERNPNAFFVRAAFAASLAMAGRQDDAEWQVVELYGLGFNKTLEEWIDEHPVQDPAYRAFYREGLARAGLQ